MAIKITADVSIKLEIKGHIIDLTENEVEDLIDKLEGARELIDAKRSFC